MLDEDGFLPPGRSRVTVEQFREAFVDAFPDSKSRPIIFQQWLEHRKAIESLVPISFQWIDGSYVTDKLNPGDMDVVTAFDGATLDSTPAGVQPLLQSLLDGSRTKAAWGIDSYAIAIYPEGHSHHVEYLRMRGYWDWWLGRVRDDDSRVKGYIEVIP